MDNSTKKEEQPQEIKKADIKKVDIKTKITNIEIIKYYALYLTLFFISQTFSMWGQYVTLPFKTISNWEAYKMAIPYAWIGWVFMTGAVYINNLYELTTPNQVVLLLIIVQNFIMVFIDKLYFGNDLLISYLIGFSLMLLGFYISLYKVISNIK